MARMKHKSLVALAVVLPFFLVSCQPKFGSTNGSVHYDVLTSASGENYSYQSNGDSVTASTPTTNTDDNIRQVFWRDDAIWNSSQQYCTEWNSVYGVSEPGGSTFAPYQPGLAMRIAPTGPNGTGLKAVTITQNIAFGAGWLFWVDTWDTTRDGDPFVGVQMFDLTSIVLPNGMHAAPAPAPWHICARTLGLQFSFKVWTGSDPEPAWDDSTHVFTTTLPEGWDYPGYSGGYIGHLRAGQQATQTFQSDGLTCDQADMAATCQAIVNNLSTTTTSTP